MSRPPLTIRGHTWRLLLFGLPLLWLFVVLLAFG